ncbi:thiamine phosphate synthase [Clostridium sp. AM58-1XD]|uniref:thiamine phosphate synthase n=1 Tax=Clostridium sp. AM58-1XD TaxID=2292307 RepID=UPI000E4C2083|nr:thiamine phosphate synthase [Clostridium sp. AM58-1XD]RGY99063.1 thiamine phosphate synthase [Clostridium sp. AM58-1XD]
MKFAKEKLLLYAVTDRAWTGKKTLGQQIEETLQAGATFLQLREKNLTEEEFLDEAVKVKKITEKYGVPLIINDNVDVSIKSGADGVHVGQSDMEAGNVRALLGDDKILGVTAKTVEQAKLAEKRGADYLGVGTVFPTSTKPDALAITMDTLRDICSAVSIPVVAIGGITKENISMFEGTGVDGVALVSAIFGQEDIEAATMDMKERAVRVVESGRS